MNPNTLSPESRYFIQALADRLNGRKSSAVEGINWDEVYRLASKHKVEGMLYLQSRPLLPREKQATFGVNAMLQFQDSQRKAAALEKIEACFTAHGIVFLLVKGLEVAQFYPAVKERTMGDLDIVVHSEDKARAGEALMEMGYQNHSVGFYDWQYDLGEVHLELHDHLQYENLTLPERFQYTETLWEHVSPSEGSTRLQLNWNFHLIFLLLHLQKHFENGGIGFRLFIDLVVVCQKAGIDFELLRADLEALKLYKFASLCFALCERWFDITMPFAAELTDEFYMECTEKILTNGVFGSAEDEMDHFVYSRMNDRGRLGAIRNRYFPSVNYLKADPRFTYLEKYPVLLPLAWLQRDIYSIQAGKLSGEMVRFTRFFTSKEKMQERNRFLADWGIERKFGDDE